MMHNDLTELGPVAGARALVVNFVAAEQGSLRRAAAAGAGGPPEYSSWNTVLYNPRFLVDEL
jgi:hypothetical protein